ncbi:MAG: glycoside hydrolase family 172 protein, partial [Steroidobacteraceae bacterium]
MAAIIMILIAIPAAAQTVDGLALYQFQPDSNPRWASPENPTAARGAGGRENKGAKGHAFETIPAGKSHVLADIKGAGIIDRMWITINDRSPEMLRSLRLDVYW